MSLRAVAIGAMSSATLRMERLPSDHVSLGCQEVDSGKGVWEREGKSPASASLPLEMHMLSAQLTGSSVLGIMTPSVSCLL